MPAARQSRHASRQEPLRTLAVGLEVGDVHHRRRGGLELHNSLDLLAHLRSAQLSADLGMANLVCGYI